MSNRRTFLKQTGLGTMLTFGGALSLDAFAENTGRQLTILHTNDMHSQLEPFPDNHKLYPGIGGMAARKKLIDHIRSEGHPVLLLDAGDIFQGTPYFNFFGGEPEIRLMSQMGYDAATLGNHDFDGGLNNIEKQLLHANFPFINSNYDLNNSVLKGKILPYKIFAKNGIRIGVLGLGVELDGLVPRKLYEGIVYRDPLTEGQKVADYLKLKKKCNLIIALSHLGYKYNSNKISDIQIAERTKYIDIIIGGHTHTFMDQPDIRKNIEGQEVLIHQVGWAGIKIGRIDVRFEKNLGKNRASTQTVIVDKKQIAF